MAAGETLSEIARGYGVKTSELASANGISNANLIRIGQALVDPRRGPAFDARSQAPLSSTTGDFPAQVAGSTKATTCSLRGEHRSWHRWREPSTTSWVHRRKAIPARW